MHLDNLVIEVLDLNGYSIWNTLKLQSVELDLQLGILLTVERLGSG